MERLRTSAGTVPTTATTAFSAPSRTDRPALSRTDLSSPPAVSGEDGNIWDLFPADAG